jgi:hypothetical protein
MSREQTIFWKSKMGVSGLLVALAVLIAFMTVVATGTLTATHAASGTTSAPILYAIHTDGSIWEYDGQNWTEIYSSNSKTADIVASQTTLYQLQLDGTILVYTGTPLTGWQVVDGSGTAVQILMSSDGAFYKQNTDASIWKYSSQGNWSRLSSADGGAAGGDIAAGPGGVLYAIHSSGVYQYTGVPMTGWQQIDNTMLNGYDAAEELAVTTNGKLYEIRATEPAGTTSTVSNVWAYNSPNHWTQISSENMNVLRTGGNGSLYKLGANGLIKVYSGSGTSWTTLTSLSQTMNFTVSATNQVFAIQRTTLGEGTIWMLVGSSWKEISTNLTYRIASTAGGYGVNAAG